MPPGGPVSQSFLAKLQEAAARNESLLCVGLDPDPALMPIEDVAAFNRVIIEATSDLVCCYKPNIAFYEALGESGYRALRETLEMVPGHIPVLVDAKRGDVGNTASAYARALFDVLGVDAVTINAYGGRDACEPFLSRAERGVFVWCRSSNPGAGDLQDLPVAEGGSRPLWQAVALRAREWNERGNVGLVLGATYPEQVGEARRLCPEMPILLPAIGAQGGDLAASVRAGLDAAGGGLIVSASRSVLYASRGRDFGLAARAEASRLREAIDRERAATGGS
jgi:orotidine-5'-phosphate decarboxylase